MPAMRRLQGLALPAELPLRGRSARDQAVLFEPGCASLLLPLLEPADVEHFACREPTGWLPAIDTALVTGDGWPAWLAGQAGMRLFLRGANWPADRPFMLACGELRAAALPWLVATPDGARVALCATRVLVRAPLVVLPAASELELALWSTPRGRAALAAGGEAVPAVDDLTAQQLTAWAGAAREAQRERLQLERRLVDRLHADFAPPGVRRDAAFTDWPQLEYAQLAARVAEQFQNPIPSRFVAPWQQRLRDAAQEHARLIDEIVQLRERICAVGDGCWAG